MKPKDASETRIARQFNIPTKWRAPVAGCGGTRTTATRPSASLSPNRRSLAENPACGISGASVSRNRGTRRSPTRKYPRMKFDCNCPTCRRARGETVMSVEEAAAKLGPVLENLATVAEALHKTLHEIKGPGVSAPELGKDFAHGLMTVLLNYATASMRPGAPPLAKYEYFKSLAMSGINSNIEADKEADAAGEDIPEAVKAMAEALGIDLSNVIVIRGNKA